MQPSDSTRFVLVGTSHRGNVGAAARAMKVMGFSDLVLVAPRFPDVLSHEETVAMASGAVDVLARARIVDSLPQALDGISFACATAMTPRDFGPMVHAPRPLLAELATSPHRIGFVFGSERYGLANDDVYRCQACLSIPTAPGYGSLNLAQALQVIAYEWRCALGGFAVAPRTVSARFASIEQVQGLLAHWRAALVDLGFLKVEAPKKLIFRLNSMINRAQLTVQDVDVLRGIARAAAPGAGVEGVVDRRSSVEPPVKGGDQVGVNH